MSFYRTLLWWLALAALGALAWEFLTPDLGEVVIRWHGYTARTTVAFALLAWGLLSFSLWALWTLARLPFIAWRDHAKRQGRNRLINGLIALHEGRHQRAENLLAKAAEDTDARSVARLGAREAALRRGDLLAAATQQSELAKFDAPAATLNTAEALLAQGKAGEALDVLQPMLDNRSLPPRGLLLRGEALCNDQRAIEAVAMLDGLRSGQNLSVDALATLERRWQNAALQQSPDADELHRRWQQLPARLQEQPELVTTYAQRAGALGLEAEAATTLTDALDRQWQDGLIEQLALLPAARDDQRLAHAERWLAQQPTNAALSLALARLYRRQQLWGKADDFLHRAIAQGGGAAAWEELGHLHTAQNQPEAAQTSYANALRLSRGEPAIGLGGRSLREQIAAEAVGEERNEFGVPQARR